jgi:pyruvate dehydrogenase E1 component beta subunit
VPIGKAAIQRQGNDVTVVSYSRLAGEARAAAEIVADQGISVEVIDLRTIAPWDRETVLASARKTGRRLL